jgi:hypothetical protein
MQMNTVESVKEKPKIINRVLLVFYCIVFVLCALYTFTIYCEVSVHRGNPDQIVDDSIAKIIGHNYIDSNNLTREAVILIASDVFVQVKQDGFKETEEANAVMGRAIIMKMLEGDERGYRIKDLATKEEALAFIGRGLGIPQYYGIEFAPPDEIESSDWSAQPIENLIDQGCLSVDEILDLKDLHELITVSKLKFVLSRVAETRMEKINSWRYDVLNNPFFHAIYTAGSLIYGIGIVSILRISYQIVTKMSDKKLGKNQNQKGEEQKRLDEQRSQEEEQKQQEESPKRLDEQRSQENDQKKLEERHNRWRKVQIRQREGRMSRMESRRAKMRKNRAGKRTKRAKRRS